MADSATRDRASEVARQLSNEFLGALIVIDETGVILEWNDGAAALFGFTKPEIHGKTVFDTIVPPELADAKRRSIAAAMEVGTATYEAERCRKDGLRIWVDVSARAQRDDGTTLVILNERDVTRAKYRREADVLQTRFRGVLEAAPDAFVIVDASGRVALVNSETERLFGYTRDDLLGELVERLVPARYHKGHPAHRAKYFADPQTRPMGIGLELSGRRKDGSEFPVEISLSPLNIDGARLAMAAIRDVSARKKTEEALKAANSELEAFTYSVSHDLRAPIRQIEGFSKILAEHLGTETDAKTLQYLRRIQDGTQHMGRLVDDLLHLAQLGQQDIRPRQVELDTLVADVVANLQADNAARTIDWHVAPLPVVVCDPGLIRVVFTNLLSNAVKYTRNAASARIEVGATGRDGVPAIFVRDNGVGFDMKYADKLFGVFQRLHRAEEFEGTGVGLATVQRIIRKHGGTIWAEATVGTGATFYFTLARTPTYSRPRHQ